MADRSDFDSGYYADLKKAYGYDKVALWGHYRIFGKVERRFAEWLDEEEAEKQAK